MLLLVAHHHGDVGYACLAQLADLAFDQHLAAHHQKALGLLVGYGREARRKARRHDHGVFHPVGLQRRNTLLRGRIPVCDQVLARKRLAHAVGASQRDAQAAGQGALACSRPVYDQHAQRLEFALGYHAASLETERPLEPGATARRAWQIRRCNVQ